MRNFTDTDTIPVDTPVLIMHPSFIYHVFTFLRSPTRSRSAR